MEDATRTRKGKGEALSVYEPPLFQRLPHRYLLGCRGFVQLMEEAEGEDVIPGFDPVPPSTVCLRPINT